MNNQPKPKPQHVIRQDHLNQGTRALMKYDSLTAYRYTYGFVRPEQDHDSNTIEGACHSSCYGIKGAHIIWSVYPRRATLDSYHERQPSGKFDPKPETFEMEMPYIRWLVSPKYSPWRKLIPAKPDVAVLGKDHIDVWSPEFVYRHGFVCRTGAPANFLVNFLIAGRTPYEWNFVADTWWKLVKDGVHPSVAYWFAGAYRPKTNKVAILEAYAVDNHFPLDAGDQSHHGLQRFVDGDPIPNVLNQPFFESGTYTPNNAIWADHRGDQSFHHWLPRKYPVIWKAGLHVPPERKRTFSSRSHSPERDHITYEALLELALAAQADLNMEYNRADFEKEAKFA